MTPHSPPPRAGASFAFDEARNVSVLFGGWQQFGSPLLGDTWELTGGDWLVKSWPTSPTARQAAMMAADPDRGGLLLFGGTFGGGTWSNETWRYDESGWHLLTPALSPPARYAGSLAWDPVGHRLLLVGGYGAAGILGDAWSWDGTNWTPLASGAPGARFGAAAASARPPDRMVLWGGTTSASSDEDGLVWILGSDETWRSERHPLGPYPSRSGTLLFDSMSGRYTLLGSFRGESWFLGGRIWASWMPSASEVCPGQSVRWSYTGWSPVSDVAWDFGDGTTTSGEVEPNHLYASPGVYTIRAVARFECGFTQSESRIRVDSGPPVELGNSVRVSKSGNRLRLTWTDLPADATYRLEGSSFSDVSSLKLISAGHLGKSRLRGQPISGNDRRLLSHPGRGRLRDGAVVEKERARPCLPRVADHRLGQPATRSPDPGRAKTRCDGPPNASTFDANAR